MPCLHRRSAPVKPLASSGEELVAAFGSAFWCAQFGLEQAAREGHSTYLGDWLALLRADSRALVAACSHAQQAVEYLNSAAGLAVGSAGGRREPAG